MNSKFSITDNLIFTFDASFQYVLANGGGTTVQAENGAVVRGSSAALGVDYNGDGDFLDSIRFYTPNTTNTRRWTAITSLSGTSLTSTAFALLTPMIVVATVKLANGVIWMQSGIRRMFSADAMVGQCFRQTECHFVSAIVSPSPC